MIFPLPQLHGNIHSQWPVSATHSLHLKCVGFISPCSDGKMIGQWWDMMGLCGKNIAHQFTANPNQTLCILIFNIQKSWFLPCFHGGNLFSNFKIPGTVSPFLSSTASETLQWSSLFSVLLVSNLRFFPHGGRSKISFKKQTDLGGGFNQLEKYESQWEGWHPFFFWKIKNVPNHQLVIMWWAWGCASKQLCFSPKSCP